MTASDRDVLWFWIVCAFWTVLLLGLGTVFYLVAGVTAGREIVDEVRAADALIADGKHREALLTLDALAERLESLPNRQNYDDDHRMRIMTQIRLWFCRHHLGEPAAQTHLEKALALPDLTYPRLLPDSGRPAFIEQTDRLRPTHDEATVTAHTADRLLAANPFPEADLLHPVWLRRSETSLVKGRYVFISHVIRARHFNGAESPIVTVPQGTTYASVSYYRGDVETTSALPLNEEMQLLLDNPTDRRLLVVLGRSAVDHYVVEPMTFVNAALELKAHPEYWERKRATQLRVEVFDLTGTASPAGAPRIDALRLTVPADGTAVLSLAGETKYRRRTVSYSPSGKSPFR